MSDEFEFLRDEWTQASIWNHKRAKKISEETNNSDQSCKTDNMTIKGDNPPP